MYAEEGEEEKEEQEEDEHTRREEGKRKKNTKREEEDEEWRIRPLSGGTRDIVPENILFNPAINPAVPKIRRWTSRIKY